MWPFTYTIHLPAESVQTLQESAVALLADTIAAIQSSQADLKARVADLEAREIVTDSDLAALDAIRAENLALSESIARILDPPPPEPPVRV